jgi:uncharacterized protein (DUF58 family)
MDTNQLILDEDDRELLRKRRIWYILALLLFLVSLIFRLPLVFLATLFMLLVGLIPDLWYRYALRRLALQQQVSQARLFFGEEVTLSVSIENHKLLPLPWLQVEDGIIPPLTLIHKRTRLSSGSQDRLSSPWLIWPLQRVTRRYLMRCHTRGFHLFGPLRLRSSDPFGWLERTLTVPAYASLLVYPLTAPLETLGFSSVLPFGDYATPRRLLEDPLQVIGTRDYILGDDPRRIHWKATAHTGTLQSKVYMPSSQRRLLLLLDVWNYAEASRGADAALQEFTITVAASLAVWGLEEGYMVGLLANAALMGDARELLQGTDAAQILKLYGEDDSNRVVPPTLSSPITRVPFALDAGHDERLLSALARLVPGSHASMDYVLDTEESMLPSGTTILLISAISSLSAGTMERLQTLQQYGNVVYLILTGDPPVHNMLDTGNLPVHYPGGKERWHELTKTLDTTEHGPLGTSTTRLQLD